MLVLSRKLGQKVLIGNDIVVTVLDIERGKIRLGIEAPRSLAVMRPELVQQIKAHGCTRCRDADGGCDMCRNLPDT